MPELTSDAAPHSPRSEPSRDRYDVVIIGGGPAGTTAGRYLARAGHSVLIVEKATHPRFCIGESLIPWTWSVWKELGLIERFEEAGFLKKFAAYFDFEDGSAPEFFRFAESPRLAGTHSWDVPRAEFDKLLWDCAIEDGVEGLQGTAIREAIVDGGRVSGVRVVLSNGEERDVAARLVMDCSGRTTLLGKQLDLRRKDPRLNTVAMFAHYDDILLSTGPDKGTIAIIATDFGWMWLIPFSDGRASIGTVMDAGWFQALKKRGLGRDEIWQEVLDGTPAIANRLRGASQTRPPETTANFSYTCRRFVGDGWMLVGDAAAFLDPVFSSGVHLAMMGARDAAKEAIAALGRHELPGRRHLWGYERRAVSGLMVFRRIIYAWYSPGFRDVFMRPPLDKPGVQFVKKQLLQVLAGDVYQPWRVLPYVWFLEFLGRMRLRRLEREALSLPSPQADMPAPAAREERNGDEVGAA